MRIFTFLLLFLFFFPLYVAQGNPIQVVKVKGLPVFSAPEDKLDFCHEA